MVPEREEGRLRTWLSGRLNRAEVPDRIWDVLSSRLYLDEGLEDPRPLVNEVPQAQLVERARELLPYIDIARSITEAPEWYDENKESPERPTFDAYEQQRARVFAEYLALKAAMDPEVRSWREDKELSRIFSRELLGKLQETPLQHWHELIGQKDWDLVDFPLRIVTAADDSIAKRFNNYWSTGDTVQFILADKVAWRNPVWTDDGGLAEKPANYGTINLHIEPWVPVETVVEFYKYHQLQIMGRRPRALSMRNLLVAEFVLEQLRGAWYRQLRSVDSPRQRPKRGSAWYEAIASRYPLVEEVDLSGGPSWRILRYLWNRKHPEEQYDSERRFRKDFYRAARAVVYPYHFLDREGPGVETNEPR